MKSSTTLSRALFAILVPGMVLGVILSINQFTRKIFTFILLLFSKGYHLDNVLIVIDIRKMLNVFFVVYF